jgi:hypothetical protein
MSDRRDTYTPDPVQEKLKEELRSRGLAGDWRDSDHNDRFDYMDIETLIEEVVNSRVDQANGHKRGDDR